MGSFLRRTDLRTFLAVAFSATSIFLWVTVGEVPPALLAVTCLCIGVVVGVLGTRPQSTVLEAVSLPYIPNDQKES